jgi:hypothetical protein
MFVRWVTVGQYTCEWGEYAAEWGEYAADGHGAISSSKIAGY